jgi:hypothetical protein
MEGVAPTTCTLGHERAAVRVSDDELTALTFLDATVYPHQQSEVDATMLGRAIGAVKAGDWEAARDAVGAVDLNSLAELLDREAFEVELVHHSPGYERLSWGALGQPSEPIDLFRVSEGLGRAARGGAAHPDAWLDQLRAAKAYAVGVYRDRVAQVTSTLESIASELEAAAAC